MADPHISSATGASAPESLPSPAGQGLSRHTAIGKQTVSGLVLAGGQARRMQADGRKPVEKGLLPLHGKPLVAWVHSYLAPRTAAVYVSANRCVDAYARYGQVVGDDPALGEDAGPLAGLASVLPQLRTPWLFSLPVDVPAPPSDLLERLAAQAHESGAGIVYAFSERAHPLCMLVHRDMLPGLLEFLRGGERKVGIWQERSGAVQAVFSADDAGFFNINTPADLLLAEQLKF
ncbi:molybdenum cofactor guanylyltransferase MobA [Eoetvoesiella caeni]